MSPGPIPVLQLWHCPLSSRAGYWGPLACIALSVSCLSLPPPSSDRKWLQQGDPSLSL